MVSLYLPIVKFILALKLELSKPQRNHLFTLVHGIILCAGRKNITQIRNAARQGCHLSSITNFLNHAPWCVNRMQRRRMQFVMENVKALLSWKDEYAPSSKPPLCIFFSHSYLRVKSCEFMSLSEETESFRGSSIK
ncbi:hypothetical protein PSAB_16330 [Paenibacillus sabinae T27]|uniref:Uncharacterized protein n=1 Tax=Paenibacillus sabinae T27 TaxID=1268072 RepID=X5A1B2_9BACL|nr:hypothetical protein PSAB_16330 [Paenibacillus sabinae T27]